MEVVGMIEPAKVCLFIPPGLKKFKLNLFERIAQKITHLGGYMVRHRPEELDRRVRDGLIPIIGCTPELRPYVQRWTEERRPWIYWDRGYFRRAFASDLPWGTEGGYYRWHVNSFQMTQVQEVPGDRWQAAKTPLAPWARGGGQGHIVVAEPSPTYMKFHGIEGWTDQTVRMIKNYSTRRIVTRDKEQQRFGRKLHQDLKGAHCLVTHGSNAAVEAVIQGCPVFVDPSSAAALVGLTSLDKIEQPVYPEREPWVRALAYSQFNERELVDGTLWRLIN